jgi:2-hydroxychromene-2-carboxylate isomerase
MATIDYYFSLLSPWAYIGHAPFMDIVRRRGVTVHYKPVALAQVFAETGGLPLAKRHPARQRYRMFELQRWREKRGLSFHLHPKFWPFDGNPADRFVIAIAAGGHDPDRFLRESFAGVWEGQQNLGEESTLLDIARAAGLSAAELLAAEGRGDAEAIRGQRARRHRSRRLRLALLRARRRSLLGAGSPRAARRRAGLRACALSV